MQKRIFNLNPNAQVCVFPEKCFLQEDNRKYKWQLLYLVISLAYLIFVPHQLTSYSILMFAFPIAIDLWDLRVTFWGLKVLRRAYIGLNGLLVLVGLFGAFGAFVEKDTAYVIAKGAVFWADGSISKKCWLF